MFVVIERFDATLIEGVDNRRLDRSVERLLWFEFDRGVIQESFFVQPIGVSGGRH